jgi:DNA-binding CsgD family transcriptional regulator
VDAAEHNAPSLDEAIEALPGTKLSASLSDVVACLPVAVSVETASVRVLDAEGDVMHLLAAVGMPSLDVRKFGLEQLTVSQARSLLAVGPDHTLAHALGLTWLDGEWLTANGEILGIVFVGSRTSRRPSEDERAHLVEIAERIAAKLAPVDRSGRTLRAQSLSFLRRLICEAPLSQNGVLAALRPRERTILELYAEGLGTGEIAELLVISPHTVRTHLKLAYRRLGVHSREEATELVRRDQLLTLL